MAREGYTGTVDTPAPVDQPNDQLRVEASPASFGAGIGAGLEAAGQGAIDYSKFYNQVSADQATNNLLQQGTAILHGDPSKPATDAQGNPILGPDGKPLPDTGFLGKRGADAMSAAPDAQQALDNLIAEQREGLRTPAARLQFDNESRRYRTQFLATTAEHADTQQRVWAQDTNNTTIQNAVAQAALAPDNDIAAAMAQRSARQAAVRNAQLAGENADGAVLKADQLVADARIRSAIGQNKGDLAERLFDNPQIGGVLASRPDYDQLARQVKETVINGQFTPAVDSFIQSATSAVQGRVGDPTTAGKPDTNTLVSAFAGQESGNNPNAPTSVTGARGRMQIEPATFAAFARPGENIANPADNLAVGERILEHYNQQYNGDVARVAVAYFSGPGNVAPPDSPTPWKQDRADPTGKTVSSYVSNIESRLTKYPSTADAMAASKADVMDQAHAYAERLWPQFLDVQARFETTIERQWDQRIAQQHQNYEVATHIVQSAMAGPNPPISEEDLISSSPQVAAAWNSMKFNNPLAAVNMEKMFDANAHGAAQTYGTNFIDYLDRVTAPPNDPARVANAAQLAAFVEKGEGAPLTNTGVNQLNNLLGLRGSPEGDAQVQQIRDFVHQMHGNLTFSNQGTGIFDEKGEARFNRYMAVALPTLEKAAKAGTLGQVLDPKNPDYIGKMAATFMRTPAQILRDRMQYDAPPTEQNPQGIQHPLLQGPAFTPDTLGQALGRLENDRQRNEFLVDAVKSGRLNKATMEAYEARTHAAKPPPGGFFEVPRPTIEQPGQ